MTKVFDSEKNEYLIENNKNKKKIETNSNLSKNNIPFIFIFILN